MGEAFPEADGGVVGAGQTMTVWAGPTPVSTTDLGGRGGACPVGGAVSGLTTVGRDAVVDNVVVLGVALPVWAETVELSCGERAAVGKKGGGVERVRASVGALRLISHLSREGPFLPVRFQMKKLRLWEGERPARLLT